MFAGVGALIDSRVVKKSLIAKERKVALYAGFEVRCPKCGFVPQYFVDNVGGQFGVRFWCEVCKKSMVLSKGVNH